MAVIRKLAHANSTRHVLWRLETMAMMSDVDLPDCVIIPALEGRCQRRRVEAANMDALGTFIVAKVQTVAGVARTLTCPIVRL